MTVEVEYTSGEDRGRVEAHEVVGVEGGRLVTTCQRGKRWTWTRQGVSPEFVGVRLRDVGAVWSGVGR